MLNFGEEKENALIHIYIHYFLSSNLCFLHIACKVLYATLRDSVIYLKVEGRAGFGGAAALIDI